jgi:nicotinamide phosphoribosyltransferase
MSKNLLTTFDAYKFGHAMAMKPKFTKNYAYAEARIGAKYDVTNVFGITPIVKDLLLEVPTNAHIEEAVEDSYTTFGENYFQKDVWKKVQKLGYIPVNIYSLPEGLNVPVSTPLFTYESTKDWFAPVVNGIETPLMKFWKPTAISSRSASIKRKLRPITEKSGTPALLEFMVTDFGARGVSCERDAEISGAAHMIHFQSSDNMAANRFIHEYYGYQGRAKSVFATEHSVALSFGPGKGEVEYLKHQLLTVPLRATFAIVIDTYDSDNFMLNVVSDPEIVELIKKRAEAGGSVTFRPDSGTPAVQVEMVLSTLAGIFGYHLNSKHYKVLNHNVRCIQGDGMNEDSIIALYEGILANKWSSDNLFVGSGGGLLTVGVDRDTQRVAIKPSFGIIDGVEYNFQKTPKSDSTKASKTGRLKVHPGLNGNMRTISSANETPAQFKGYVDLLQPLFIDGQLVRDDNFKDIIERANQPYSF